MYALRPGPSDTYVAASTPHASAFCSTAGGTSPSRNGFSSSSVCRKPSSRLNSLPTVEAPTHPLLVSLELLQRSPRDEHQLHVPRRQVDRVRVEVVRDRRADRAAGFVFRAE